MFRTDDATDTHVPNAHRGLASGSSRTGHRSQPRIRGTGVDVARVGPAPSQDHNQEHGCHDNTDGEADQEPQHQVGHHSHQPRLTMWLAWMTPYMTPMVVAAVMQRR